MHILTTKTHSTSQKQEKQAKENQRRIATLFKPNSSSMIIRQPTNWRLTTQRKVLGRFFPRLFQGNNGFYSCRPAFESVLVIIVCAKDLPYPGRVTGGTSRHPIGSPGDAHPRACFQPLAAILACWSSRPLAKASFELLHL